MDLGSSLAFGLGTLLCGLMLLQAMPEHVYSNYPFFFALILTSTVTAKTVPVAIAEFTGRYVVDVGGMMTGGVLAAIPPVLLSLIFQVPTLGFSARLAIVHRQKASAMSKVLVFIRLFLSRVADPLKSARMLMQVLELTMAVYGYDWQGSGGASV